MKSTKSIPIAIASVLAPLALLPQGPVLAECLAPAFAPAVHYETGRGCWSVAVGDFNGDSIPDLATANRYAGNISVLLGNGDGSFHASLNKLERPYCEAVSVADLDGDGNVDLIVGNGLLGNISVILGNGDGTFRSPVDFPAGTHPGNLAVADFNQDGKLDLAAADVSTDKVVVTLGNGDGTFQTPVSYRAGDGAQSVAVGDLNTDGYPDLIVPHYVLFEFWVYSGIGALLGNGDGTFQVVVDDTRNQEPVSAALGDWPVSAAVGDFNGDTKPDVAVANKNSNGSNSRNILVLAGNDDATFKHGTNYGTGLGAQAVAVNDFNGDGRPDLVVGNSGSDDVAVLVGNGDGTFQPGIRFAVGDRPRSLLTADFNDDGRPDIVVANDTSGNVSVLLNTCASTSVQLDASRVGSDLILSWPISHADLLLRSSTNFSSPDWQRVAGIMTTNNGRCNVTLPLERVERYFRLDKP